MTRLGNSCSSRKRGWRLCSVVGFAGLAPSVWHLAGCLTAETEGEKEKTVTEAAWQVYPSNCQSKISEPQPPTEVSRRYFKGKKKYTLSLRLSELTFKPKSQTDAAQSGTHRKLDQSEDCVLSVD